MLEPLIIIEEALLLLELLDRQTVTQLQVTKTHKQELFLRLGHLSDFTDTSSMCCHAYLGSLELRHSPPANKCAAYQKHMCGSWSPSKTIANWMQSIQPACCIADARYSLHDIALSNSNG